ncbi:MAG: FtsX-like permease family protein [Frateuria sp.]|uniref:ABC transporter permease n=1 Tax=Frateuria sp. TaxID=2211372 RepID=UPI0017BB348A|nr:FtsX-like permease family protein [Frateuria sp.]NUO73001.1 FtsX-like permease family protein [Frateuria sp.]NUR23325.1 FtsX-like permease family protein [Frateuria sp.]
MQIGPILVALRRHKAGTTLIALQIALTLAIVCNALFIIQQRLVRVDRPSGVQETNLFVIQNDWPQKLSPQDADARMRADLQALRGLSSVQDASSSNSFPLRGSGWDNFVRMTPEQVKMTTDTAIFFSDEHTLATLGTRLIAGRNFRSEEVGSQGGTDPMHARQIIVSKGLAQLLFPHDSALGKTVYVSGDNAPSTIIGVTDTLQAHMTGLWAQAYAYNALLVPARLTGDSTFYLVRARPGQLADAMRQAKAALYAQTRMRMIPPHDGVMTFAQVRERAYDADYGMAILMGIICAVLLVITAAGIVGLTSFWVGQRRRQIGVRRALGARQRDILGYFLTENLLITLGGVLLGIVLALSMNLWLVLRLGVQPLSLTYLAAGVVLLLLLGQGAVLAPAMKASRVPPVEATRSV